MKKLLALLCVTIALCLTACGGGGGSSGGSTSNTSLGNVFTANTWLAKSIQDSEISESGSLIPLYTTYTLTVTSGQDGKYSAKGATPKGEQSSDNCELETANKMVCKDAGAPVAVLTYNPDSYSVTVDILVGEQNTTLIYYNPEHFPTSVFTNNMWIAANGDSDALALVVTNSLTALGKYYVAFNYNEKEVTFEDCKIESENTMVCKTSTGQTVAVLTYNPNNHYIIMNNYYTGYNFVYYNPNDVPKNVFAGSNWVSGYGYYSLIVTPRQNEKYSASATSHDFDESSDDCQLASETEMVCNYEGKPAVRLTYNHDNYSVTMTDLIEESNPTLIYYNPGHIPVNVFTANEWIDQSGNTEYKLSIFNSLSKFGEYIVIAKNIGYDFMDYKCNLVSENRILCNGTSQLVSLTYEESDNSIKLVNSFGNTFVYHVQNNTAGKTNDVVVAKI